jgi:hypothetical protein
MGPWQYQKGRKGVFTGTDNDFQTLRRDKQVKMTTLRAVGMHDEKSIEGWPHLGSAASVSWLSEMHSQPPGYAQSPPTSIPARHTLLYQHVPVC